jgi:hypothetical protein
MATSVDGVDDGAGFGVRGTATGGDGIVGTTRGIHKAGVRGVHTGHISAIAIIGELDHGTAAVKGQVGGGAGGVGGDDVIGSGVWGDSSRGPGIVGTSSAAQGVLGEATAGNGVAGVSASGRGVAGFSDSFQGVYGHSETQAGVVGESTDFDGVFGVTHKATAAAVSGHNRGGLAGFFDGNVIVTGDLQLTGGDVAEQFDVSVDLPAGSVVCLDGSARVEVCRKPYDKRVAGIVSGLQDRRPALILDRSVGGRRQPIAVVGKAWCLADADDSPIEVGDLLTTSGHAGHAMAVRRPTDAFGAVIGKALSPLAAGRGSVLVLVGLG